MANSKITLDQLRQVLGDEGLAERRDFTVTVDSTGDLIVSVKVAPNISFLPEELKAHEPAEEQITMALKVGGAKKKTRDGVRFELALRAYRKVVFADEQLTELLDNLSPERSAEFNAQGDAVWERIMAGQRIEEFEEELREHYY